MVPKQRANRWQPTGEKLPAGGQADTCVVLDLQGQFGGEHVLKVYRFSGRTPEGRRARFQYEVEQTRRLHGAGAPVLDIVDDSSRNEPDARAPWYVSPRAPGGSLRARLPQGKCFGGDESAAVSMFRGVVDAVAHLHDEGVTHRDLKPDNILLGKDDAVILGDLGLCLALDSDGAARRTETLEQIGARHYMPPEALRGRPPIGQGLYAWDYYALGKILYELLAGRVLPGDMPHTDSDYALDAGDKQTFYALVDVMLHGLLARDPGTRRQTWDATARSLDAAERELRRDVSHQPAAMVGRLAGVSSALARRRQADAAEAEKRGALVRRCESLATSVGTHWLKHPDVSELLEKWAENHSDFVFKIDDVNSSNVRSMVLEPAGDTVAPPAEVLGPRDAVNAGSFVGLGLWKTQDGHRDTAAYLYMAMTAFITKGCLTACVMMIEMRPDLPHEILSDTLKYRTANPHDASLDSWCLDCAETLVPEWLDRMTAMLKRDLS